jgi:hypothetical protein
VTAPRAILILFGILTLCGCGAAKTAQTTPKQQATTTIPSVQPLNEPATIPPPGATPTMCPDIPIPCRPQEAVKPESPPRAIAELQLRGRNPRTAARLNAWRNHSGQLCLETQVNGANSAPFGPCLPGRPCAKICVQLLQTKTGGEALYLLGGVLASGNDTLRVTTEDGHVSTYEVTGPVVPGFSDYRVFMLDLGRNLYRRLELLAGDHVAATETLSAAQIGALRCNENPPVLPSQDAQGQNSPLHKCVQRATPK